MGPRAHYTGRVGSHRSRLRCQSCRAGTVHSALPTSSLWRSQQAGHKVRSKNRKRPRPPDSVDHRAPPKLLRRVKQALGQERESKPQQRGRRSRYRDGTGAGAGAWVTALPEGSLREEEARVLEKKRSPHKAGTEAQSTWLTLALITVAGSPPAAVAMKAAATVPRATRGRGSWGRRGWGQV